MSSKQKTKIISSLIIVVAAVAGFLLSKSYFKPQTSSPVEHHQHQQQQQKQTQAPEFKSLLAYPKLKTFSGFELIDQNQKKRTIDDFEGHWTLMFFGFTYCPDVCPTALNQLQRIYKKLENIKNQQGQSLTQNLDIMLVSVDPERDTPEQLKTYIEFFNPKFSATTADKGSLLSLSKQLGVAYHIEDHEPGDKNYDVNHTAAMFLVNPEKQLYGIFQTPHEDEALFHDLKILLEK